MPHPRSALRLVLLLILTAAPSLPAATLTVNDTGEGTDATPGDGVCATAGAVCTLRAAIQEANALAGADTIVLPDLPASTVTHYVQNSLLPNVTTAITVMGTSRTNTRIESGAHGGIFYVVGGTLTLQHAALTGVTSGNVITAVNGGSITLDDILSDGNSALTANITGTVAPYPTLTVQNSTLSNNTGNFGGALYLTSANLVATNTIFSGNHANQYGGAIYIDGFGSAAITSCQFTNNSSAVHGGAILSYSPLLTVSGSTFTGNSSAVTGGAILNYGTAPQGATVAATVSDCTFDSNTAGDVNHSSSNGGGFATTGPALVLRSTFTNNSATSQGGGLATSTGGLLILTDSTVSGNSAPLGGGGVYISSNSHVKLQSNTITNNTASGAYGGGGIYVAFGDTNPIKNTIVAGNHAVFSPDCNGALVSQGYNLIGDGTGCTLGTLVGDQVGTGASPIDAHLTALANNGGPTRTHALQANSPAGDRGNPAGCTDDVAAAIAVDQRGPSRATDGDSDGTARCDIGAYEAPAGTFPTPTTTTTTTTSTTTATATTLPGSTTTTTTAVTTTTSAGATTTTTLPGDDPICVGGVTISKAKLTLGKIAAPTGDESIALRGTLDFDAGTPATFDPAGRGVQLLIEDLGSGASALLDLTHRGTPVPGGAGCSTKDGWKKTRYRNGSGMLPSACTAGSAQGLAAVRLADRRAKRKGIPFSVKTKRSTFDTPVGPFRATIVLGASAQAGLDGECGVHEFAPSACKASAKRIQCR